MSEVLAFIVQYLRCRQRSQSAPGNPVGPGLRGMGGTARPLYFLSFNGTSLSLMDPPLRRQTRKGRRSPSGAARKECGDVWVEGRRMARCPDCLRWGLGQLPEDGATGKFQQLVRNAGRRC